VTDEVKQFMKEAKKEKERERAQKAKAGGLQVTGRSLGCKARPQV
jgi:hypothetical protein